MPKTATTEPHFEHTAFAVLRTSRRGIGRGIVTNSFATQAEAQNLADFMNRQNSRHEDRDDVVYVVEKRKVAVQGE
jgi:hypothetical protein